MTPEQRKAHERMLSILPGKRVLADEELDEPKNWRSYNRELTPSELAHARNIFEEAA